MMEARSVLLLLLALSFRAGQGFTITPKGISRSGSCSRSSASISSSRSSSSSSRVLEHEGGRSALASKGGPSGGDEPSGESGTRRAIIKKTSTAALASIFAATKAATGVPATVSAMPWDAPAEPSPAGLPPSGKFTQHAVVQVSDMDATVKFWTEGLGMKVIRSREVNGAKNVFVAYGPETLVDGKDGGYFSLELVYKPGKAGDVYMPGNVLQYFGLTLPKTLQTVAYLVNEAGGGVVPHWFATKDYAEFLTPDGIRVRVKEGKKRDPFTVIALGTKTPQAALKYFKDTLGMKDQGSLLNSLGALVGVGGQVLGYGDSGSPQQVQIILSEDKNERMRLEPGDMFKKIAVVSRDTAVDAAKVEESSFGKVLFAGEVPGIGTKVANTITNEGQGVVFVDYEDFEKEL